MSTENTTTGKVQLTIAQLKKDQGDGLNRKAIAAKYGASVSIINKLFKHPELQKLRPKHASNFELVDETGETYSPGQLAMEAEAKKAAEKAAKGEDEATEQSTGQADTEVAAPATEQVTESAGI